jgi:hypothetical protein
VLSMARLKAGSGCPAPCGPQNKKGVEYEAIGEAGSRNRVTARSWGYYIPAVSTSHGKTEGLITLGLGLVSGEKGDTPSKSWGLVLVLDEPIWAI